MKFKYRRFISEGSEESIRSTHTHSSTSSSESDEDFANISEDEANNNHNGKALEILIVHWHLNGGFGLQRPSIYTVLPFFLVQIVSLYCGSVSHLMRQV